MLRTIRFITLLLTALGLTMGAAHVLELPAKMQYNAEMYMAVTSTLYRLFGTAGAAIQVGALLFAVLLVYLVRGRPTFRLTLWGTLGIILSLVLWGILVAPVNAEWQQVIETAPGSAPETYLKLRLRWEFGHVAAFSAWLVGFILLLLSVIRETPPNHFPDPSE